MHRLRGIATSLPAAAAIVPIVLASLVGACAPPVGTGAPSRQPTAAPSAAPPSIDIEQPGLTPSAGQVDTDWGPIWETVPGGFPVPARGEPIDVETGPVSAAWIVPGGSAADARAIADFYGRAFSDVGYGGGVDGPLEDGSFTTWSSNGYGCDILVTVLPRGEVESLATVLYGAGCPFDWPE